MRRTVRFLALVALIAAFASPALADCEGMREFSGLIQSFKKTGKRAGFVIDNRMGDKVKFRKAENVEIVDERGGDKPVTEWKGLKNNMYASVCWKFTDDPRLAHKVTVKPEPKDDAEDA